MKNKTKEYIKLYGNLKEQYGESWRERYACADHGDKQGLRKIARKQDKLERLIEKLENKLGLEEFIK